MAEAPPFSMQGVCLSPLGLRQFVGSIVCGEGVANVAAGELLVSPSGADGSVSVAQGSAFVLGEDVNDQGMYQVFNDAATVVGPLDANATGNPRIDLIVAQVSDSTYGALSDAWTLDHVTGTANASAALTVAGLAFAPAVPTDSVILAYVLVPNGFGAGSTVSGANILDARYSYTSCGGQPVFRAYRAAAFNTASPGPTILAYDTVSFNTFGPGTVGASGTLFNTSTGVFTAPATGYYRVGAAIREVTGATTDQLGIAVYVNGASVADASYLAGQSGSGMTAIITALVFATAGQTIDIRNGASTARTGGPGASLTWFEIQKIAA